ncbi:MAG: sodium:proton antiporter [Bacteroidales bacterium]|nr:sodium:proton antiporter [Bacteroidales bacterium]
MKRPSLLLSLFPLMFLVTLIATLVPLFGDDITSGPAQIALLSAALVTSLISILFLKVSWEKIEASMLDQLAKTGSAIFILLMIGALTGSWMQSGVVPTMIYYGMKLIHPSVFLMATFILTAVVSLTAGSSWTTIGTVGVAMLTAGQFLGFSAPWLAGAIISGAYLGDKCSPLSDTVNLCASSTGISLYKHVRYQLYTAIPAGLLSIIFFGVAGFMIPTASTIDISAQSEALQHAFRLSPWLLLVPAFTIFLIIKKVSPFITLLLSALLGAVVAVLFQPELCRQMLQLTKDSGSVMQALEAGLLMLSGNVQIETGNEMLNTLTATRGMAGMLNTVWLILCVVTFGGAMDASGMIQVITEKMALVMRNAVSLVGSTVGTCIFFNLTLSDQYMSIVLPGKMFLDTYKKKGFEPELLSRTLGDSGTVTSVLVPWNTCGIVQASVLQVATLSYLPYCFFNLITPFITILIAAIGYKIRRIK